MHRLLLNHLKHVTGSRYAPWRSGPCASVSHCCSAGTLGFDRACIRRRLPGSSGLSTFSLCGTSSGTSAPTLLAVLFQLFCHTGLLRELFRLLLAMLLFHGFLSPNPWLFYFLHGHLARVSFTQFNDFNANFSFGITAVVHSMEPAQF